MGRMWIWGTVLALTVGGTAAALWPAPDPAPLDIPVKYPAETNAAHWHVETMSGACEPSMSPADWIKQVRANGYTPEITEERDPLGFLMYVSVAVPVSAGLQQSARVFYRQRNICDDYVAEKNRVPDAYR